MQITDYIHPRYWLSWIGFGCMRLISLLPVPVLARIANGLGALVFLLMRSRREIALTNLRISFPDMDEKLRQATAKRCFQLIAQTTLCMGINWWASPTRLRKLVSFAGRQHFDDAVAQGRNVILLAPHAISLEMGGLLLCLDTPIITMYQRTRKPLLNAMVKAHRGRFGGELFERSEPLRKLIKLIRSRQPFYYLPDQDGGERGIFVPFFGQPASTVPMLSKFAQMTDAAVLPCFTHVLPAGKGWHCEIGEPLSNFPTGDVYADTERMNQVIESMVRDAPEQYFWVHKRFKTQPEGEPSVYKSARVN